MSTVEPRPEKTRRRFDRAVALRTAMELFWRQGYETTSIADLVRALEIKAPSLYATFGNKERLFLEAVAQYESEYGDGFYRVLEESPSAKEAIHRVLRDAARSLASGQRPAGCLLESSVTNWSQAGQEVAAFVRSRRLRKEAAIRDRLVRAIAEGELPPATDAARIAKFYAAILQGMGAQARDGSLPEELEQIADTAICSWNLFFGQSIGS